MGLTCALQDCTYTLYGDDQRYPDVYGNLRQLLPAALRNVGLKDRTYVPKEKLQPVYDKGLSLWLEHVLHHPVIKVNALEEVLSCISRLVQTRVVAH